MKIMISDICEAFEKKAVGSKVKRKYHATFLKELEKAIRKHDWNSDRVNGQTVIDLSEKVNKWVSPGTWVRGSKTPKDYVLRQYRGEVGMYRKRDREMKSVRVRCVVYTMTAYMEDPDFTLEESARLRACSKMAKGYVLVAVLGDCDNEPSTVSYSRFVKNLAGANNEYAVMDEGELVGLAKKVVDYRSKYMGVAD